MERRGGVTAKNHVNFLSGEREAVKNAEFSNGISCVTNEIPETSSPMVQGLKSLNEVQQVLWEISG
jgi:hypothetical protein